MAYVASIDDALINIAAERPITALAALDLEDPTWIGVKADGPIETPADLDGKVYGGFGSAKEPLLLKALIQADGGKGEFQNVTLGTSAYEAVYDGQVDGALFYSYSDAIDAEMNNRDIRYFKFTDYDEIPTQYGIIVAANSDYLEEHQSEVKFFMDALIRGYKYQMENPEEIADMLIAAGSTASREFLVRSITEFNPCLVNEDGQIGIMDMNIWKNRADFWMKNQFLVDDKGDVLEQFPDLSEYVTNSYLPY